MTKLKYIIMQNKEVIKVHRSREPFPASHDVACFKETWARLVAMNVGQLPRNVASIINDELL